MRYFIDTEFLERGHQYPISLISLGIVAEDGRRFYRINKDYDHSGTTPWLQENVMPYIDWTRAVPFDEIKQGIIDYIGIDDKPEFWAYYADYDWVVFCQIFGSMIDLPKGWPMYCRDLKQWADEIGLDKKAYPAKPVHEHHAIADAEWNKMFWGILKRLDTRKW
jgi:hypothetical protein